MTSSFFGQTQQASQFFGREREQTGVNISGSPELVSPFYSVTLKKPILEVEEELVEGLQTLLYSEANSEANNLKSSTATSAIAQGVSTQDMTLEQIREAAQGLMFEDYVAPDVAAILADNPEYVAKEKRALERAIAAERMISDLIDAEPSGFWAGLGHFGDAVVSQTVRNIASILPGDQGSAMALAELAGEALDLLVRDMPKEQFEEEFGAILARVNDSGFFTESNPFLLQDFLAMAQEGGRGNYSDYAKAFQFMDIGFSATGGVLKAGATTAARTPRLMTRLAGQAPATDVVVESVRAGRQTPLLQTGLENGMVRLDGEMFSHPSMEIMRKLEAENQALKVVKEADWGPRVDPAIIEAKRQEIVAGIEELNKTYRRNSIDYGIRVGATGNVYGTAVLGKSATGGATPYLTRKGAQGLADSVGGEVHEVVEGGTTKFVVLREWDIPTAGLADATDLDEVAGGFLSAVMSTTARTDPRLDAMIKQGEAQVARVRKVLVRDYSRTQKRITRSEGHEIDEILMELQSDPNYSVRMEPYSRQEFAARYAEAYGRPAREEVLDHYDSVLQINDVDYYINADIMLKEAIENDETMVQLGDVWYRSKKAKGLADDTPVYYTDTGKMQKASDLKEGTVIYEVMDAAYEVNGIGRIRYVTGNKPPNTRRLYHTDVMAYNAGGHRTYTDVTGIFMKQEADDLVLAGGGTLPTRPRTFMAVRTEQEAADVMNSWNTIAKAVEDGVDNINDVILANNKWKPDIENLDDLRKFADAHGLKVNRPINWAPDNEPLFGTAKASVAQAFAGQTTVGNQFRRNIREARSRGSAPLVGYGGENLNILAPTKAIQRGFSRTLTQRGDANYLYNAINGWLKAAEANDAIKNVGDLVGKHPKQAMAMADLRDTKAGRALRAERDTIQRRMSSMTAQVAAERSVMRGFADFLYGKDKKKLAKLADGATGSDPAGWMRALAFHTKLGLFAVDQVYVQASQVINVIGITSANLGVPRAIAGALGGGPLRQLLIEDMPMAARKRIANIQASFTGIEADEMLELAEWVKRTGRDVVDHTVVEENNLGVFSHGSKVLNAGQFFFNEGEKMARLTAAATAFLERKVKYGVVDLNDPTTSRALIQRGDVLTASMTSASAAPWQRSLWAVPLQFTTYHVRMMEQIFTDRILTPKERWRLGLTHLFAYGSAGTIGGGFVADRLAHNETVDPNGELFELVRYGAMDYILSNLSGADTALSTRLAAGEGLFDLLYDTTTKKGVLEFVGGPSGQIASDTFKAFNSLVRNVFTPGGFDTLSYDWNRLARNLTGYNRAYNAWTLARYDAYYSRKTEQAQAEGIPAPEKWAIAMGIPTKDQAALWGTVANLQLDDKMLDKHTREIQRLETIAKRLLERDDYEGAANTFNDMGAMLEILTPSERRKVMQRLGKSMTIHESVVRRLITQGNLDVANYLQELTNG